MILERLITLLTNIFTSIFNGVSVDQIASSQINQINSTIDNILSSASSLIDLIIPYRLTLVLVGIVIAIEFISYIYIFVMWILRKIPVASID